MSSYYRPKGLSSALSYLDPKRALLFLEEAFGFEPMMVIVDENDKVAHSEMTYGESVVMIGSEWSDDHRSPKSVGGMNTQSVHVQLARGEDIDAHCARATKAGADIIQSPATQFYGDRTYRAKDFEGNVWTFGVTLKELTPAEWDKASGLKTRKRV